MKRYPRTEVKHTYSVAKKHIEDHDYFFFMRSKEHEHYHPNNIQTFTDERYKYAYRIQDMASLVSSSEISHFLSDIAYKLRNDLSHTISRDELDVLKKFLNDADTEYKRSQYQPLENLVWFSLYYK